MNFGLKLIIRILSILIILCIVGTIIACVFKQWYIIGVTAGVLCCDFLGIGFTVASSWAGCAEDDGYDNNVCDILFGDCCCCCDSNCCTKHNEHNVSTEATSTIIPIHTEKAKLIQAKEEEKKLLKTKEEYEQKIKTPVVCFKCNHEHIGQCSPLSLDIIKTTQCDECHHIHSQHTECGFTLTASKQVEHTRSVYAGTEEYDDYEEEVISRKDVITTEQITKYRDDSRIKTVYKNVLVPFQKQRYVSFTNYKYQYNSSISGMESQPFSDYKYENYTDYEYHPKTEYETEYIKVPYTETIEKTTKVPDKIEKKVVKKTRPKYEYRTYYETVNEIISVCHCHNRNNCCCVLTVTPDGKYV